MKDDTFPYIPYMSPKLEVQMRLSGDLDRLAEMAGKGEKKYSQAEMDQALMEQEERVYQAFSKNMRESMDAFLQRAFEDIIQQTADEIMRRLRQEQQVPQADKQDDDELEKAIMELDFES